MKIKTRNPQFTGVRAGIKFVNGVGKTSDEKAVAQLKRLGYTVEDEPEGGPGDAKSDPEADSKGEPEKQDGEAPAGNASREDWAEYAKRLGFDVLDDWKRDDIKALVQGTPEQD